MLYFDGFGSLLVLALWVFCFIDVLLTPETSCRNLPKLAWVFVVLLLPLFGSIAWLVAGRNWDRTSNRYVSTRSSSRPSSSSAGAARGGRRVPTNPDDDDEFLAGLSRRAEEQRRRAREQQERDGRDTDPA